MRLIPPIRNLVAFEAAMRLESFAAAADELSVTPGAIGQQIQKLEEWLGVGLFVRHTRHVKPTIDGLAYFAQIQPSLADIIRASRRLRERQKRVISLSMPPSFAAKWFAPRMADYLTAHPEFSLSLNTSTTVFDFDVEPFDIAVRHFDGSDPRLSVHLLHRDEARPYCSPDYRKRAKLKRPNDLGHALLLHNIFHPHWNQWLTEFTDLTISDKASITGLEFDQSLMAIEAAARGQGVVLSGPLLVEAELASGALVELFDLALPLEASYYLVLPDPSHIQEGPRSLKEWFLHQLDAA